MESIHADTLLHVIDLSDPEMEIKIGAVNNILEELGVNKDNSIYVFNKIDAAGAVKKEELIEKYKKYSPLFVSAKNRIGPSEVEEQIAHRFRVNAPAN